MAWSIDPVSLCNVGIKDRASKGKESSIDKKPRYVVYVCLGTLANFSDLQLKEIAAGLEASGREFVWVVRREKNSGDDNWLPPGFEERMEGKGLIIRGWAPQALILDHLAAKAGELGRIAKRAVEEGGSSYANVGALIGEPFQFDNYNNFYFIYLFYGKNELDMKIY
ncbi:unnamed protein product [Linum tenue]|uniref:Uncharacterized protein n=1 Tax=Linum tenue TaxID=586396 RepID=A0AAV0H0I8_9ROSI|nr:unnamed protein product [Linum tenue]